MRVCIVAPAKDTRDLALEQLIRFFGLTDLQGCREHQRGLHFWPGDLIGKFLQRVAAEDGQGRNCTRRYPFCVCNYLRGHLPSYSP